MCRSAAQGAARLAAHPSLYMYHAHGGSGADPAYPYGVVFFFAGWGLPDRHVRGETRDVFYTALLLCGRGTGSGKDPAGGVSPS